MAIITQDSPCLCIRVNSRIPYKQLGNFQIMVYLIEVEITIINLYEEE